MFRRTSALVASVGAVVAALAVFGAATSGAKAKHKGKADSGTVWAATTYNKNGIQYAAGNATDKLFGNAAVTYALKLLPSGTTGTIQITSKRVTTWTKRGSLYGSASATLTISSTGAATVTNGKLKQTKGTGAEKGHSFLGTFTGTGSATTGVYVFQYKGTYK